MLNSSNIFLLVLFNISFQLLREAFASKSLKTEHNIPAGATTFIFKGLFAELRIGPGKWTSLYFGKIHAFTQPW